MLMRVPAAHSLHLLLALYSNYFQLNSYNIIELILYQGNHDLYSMLAIASVNQLWLYSNNSRFSDTNIVCIDHTTRFEFTRIHISDVNFLGCGGNRVESVMAFTLVNTIFDGQQKEDLKTGCQGFIQWRGVGGGGSFPPPKRKEKEKEKKRKKGEEREREREREEGERVFFDATINARPLRLAR